MTTKKLTCAAATWRASTIPACVAAVLAVSSPRAHALTDLSPYATIGVEHNSNVFARPDYLPPFAETGNTDLGDTIMRYLVGINADFAWERDRLRLTAEGDRFQFNRFDELNHYEHHLGALFDYHLGPVVDGSVNLTDVKTMSGLADTLSDQLELQTDRSASAKVRFLITPRWRFDLEPRWHQLETPLPQYPEFGLKETGGAASLNYLGINKLTAGLEVRYMDGSFHHITGATNYRQTTTQLTADYAVTGFSSFQGHIGFTNRNSSLVNPADAQLPGGGAGGQVGKTNEFTGSLGYRRQLTVKTSVNLEVFREVESYVAGANSTIGTGGEAGVRWDPDVRFSVRARYRQETIKIQGDLVIANFVNREDRLRTEALEVRYFMLPWLTIRPYVSHNTRSSNFDIANYSATMIGVDFTATLNQH